jgi:hypothetical protein
MTGEDQNVVLEIRQAPRREVFEHLFTGRNIQLDWLNQSYGEEIISGVYRGTLANIARAVLSDSNFVIVYDSVGDRYWISRLVVMGKSPTGHASPGLSAVVTAMQPDSGSAGRAKALTAEQLRAVAVSSQEYLRRIERQGTWQLGSSESHLLQLGRTAGAADGYNNRFPGENNSAGLPPLFVPRPDTDTDPARITEYTQALTTQMARRNLLGLYNALKAARP